MPTILIVGAGKSSIYLIEFLMKSSLKIHHKWNLIIADADLESIKSKVRDQANVEIAVLDISNEQERQALVKRSDMVVSVMPPHLHILLAKDCLQFKKHLITSSYASPEMRELHQEVKDAGLMFMCEMGLDPGIDHMTASQMFDSIRKVASDITSFQSYCGGLIAPESDDNPWHYKFSWNPKNIISAGKDGAHFLKAGKKVDVAYHDMFKHNKRVVCDGVGTFAYYPNRDSLSYIDLYELQESSTFMRATLRHPDFCKGWDALVTLGLTDMKTTFSTEQMTNAEWIKKVVGFDGGRSLEDFVWDKLSTSDKKLKDMLLWLGLFENTPIREGLLTSGDILLDILSEKWAMKSTDKDMVVMQHEVSYDYRGVTNNLISTMMVKGEDSMHSAMAKTVGLPMAILTELVMTKSIRMPHGVLIPTMPEVYRPILTRLEKHGIVFEEHIF
jgi:saccharopine dehydrogenase-like NADP-dependent oxidoreductase